MWKNACWWQIHQEVIVPSVSSQYPRESSLPGAFKSQGFPAFLLPELDFSVYFYKHAITLQGEQFVKSSNLSNAHRLPGGEYGTPGGPIENMNNS